MMKRSKGANTPSTSGLQRQHQPASQTHLTDGLEHLWRTKAQADVTVCVEDKKIPCHKAVLMAASSYFQAMFNSCMQEAVSGEINLKEMTAKTCGLVLEFIYT